MSATMVAVDLGAQSGRVAVGRFDGERLDVEEVRRFPNEPVLVDRLLQWDVLGLYREVVAGLRAAQAHAGRVDSIGVDSWAIDFGLLDRQGRLVRNPVHYRDARRAAAYEPALARIPPRELYERTGIQLMPINTLFELAAMAAEPDPALEIAETLLLIPDLVHAWLGGARAAELTNATTTQCFDPRAADWARDLVERVGVSPSLLPDVVQPGTVVGRHERIAIVAGATHDTAAAVAAVPFRREGSAYISAGTWSLVGVEVERPAIDDRTFAANLTNEGGVGGTTRLLRNVAGMWLLHESRDVLPVDRVVELASAAEPLRSFVDPNDPVFAEPGDMPARIREYCARTGQQEPADPGALARCILESLALKHAQTLDLLRDAADATPAEVHVVGGGAQNDLLCRWTANASGLPVLAGPVEATVHGNLAVQAMALGELASLEDAREVVRRSVEPTVYEPEDEAAWREARERFDALARVEVHA
jgi:rhamnulokinase